MPPKARIILNPAAGSVTDLTALLTKLNTKLNPLGADVKITGKPGAAERYARDALRDGCQLIVAAGGDGTLNEVVNGIAGKPGDVTIALLPLGTGNDFARSLALPNELDTALEVLIAGRTRAVDLVRVTSDRVRYFVNVSAGGFSGVVNEKLTPEIKETWGPLAYARSAAAALPELRAYRTNVSLDNDECVSMDVYNVVIANGRYVAGGTPIAPEAEIDDGLLDVILLVESSPAKLAMLMAKVLVGSHLANEAVIFRRAAKVGVNSRPGMWFNVDGELVGNQPAVFEIVPRALQFVVP